MNVELLFLHLCHFWLLYCPSDHPIGVSFSSYISMVSRSSLMQTTTHFSYSFASKPLFWFCFEGLRFLAALWFFFYHFEDNILLVCLFKGESDFCCCFPAIRSQSNSRYIEKIVLFLKNILFGMIFLPFYDDEGRWNSLYALESPCGFWY